MDTLRGKGDSIVAELQVVAQGLPAGWVQPIYDRLDARIAYVMMGLNAVKGVALGSGFDAVTQHGSEHGDEMSPEGFLSNHAGGVLGGISTGQPLEVAVALKPTSSIRLACCSFTRSGVAVKVY